MERTGRQTRWSGPGGRLGGADQEADQIEYTLQLNAVCSLYYQAAFIIISLYYEESQSSVGRNRLSGEPCLSVIGQHTVPAPYHVGDTHPTSPATAWHVFEGMDEAKKLQRAAANPDLVFVPLLSSR